MTSKKRSAQRPFELVFVLSDCSLLQAIKKSAELSIAASKITIYSKSEESCSLASSFPFVSLLHRMQNGLKRRRCRQAFAKQTGHALGARNRTVLATLQFVCLFLLRTDCYGFTLPSACFSQQRCVLRSTCLALLWLSPRVAVEFQKVSPNSSFGGKVEWMSLWHDRASLARYET